MRGHRRGKAGVPSVSKRELRRRSGPTHLHFTLPLLQGYRKRKRISYMKWVLSLAILFSVMGCSAHGVVGFNLETNMVLVRGTLNTGPEAFQKDADEACRGKASLVACEEIYIPDRGTRNLCSYRCPGVSGGSTASNSH